MRQPRRRLSDSVSFAIKTIYKRKTGMSDQATPIDAYLPLAKEC